METKYEYTRTTYAYHSSYVRNIRAVGVLWGIFTICFAIINILVFIQPYWLGSTDSSPLQGHFGLYKYCIAAEQPGITGWTCSGQFDTFDNILSPYFKAATVLIGISALLSLLCIACMVLFFFLRSRIVYSVCASIQFVSFCCMLSGCIVFAAGWDHPKVGQVCGHQKDKFAKGVCELRWAYVLAIIGIFDVLFLCILGFILACKQVKLLPEHSIRGESNLGFNGAYMRGPMIAPTDAEHMSVVAPSTRSKAEYASAHNFQL